MNTLLKVPAWLVMLLALCLLALATASVTYKVLYDNTSTTLVDLRADVDAKNQEAADKLAELTAESDAKQAALDRQRTEQEQADNERTTEIDRLTAELRDRPIRVRYVSVASRPSGGGSASDPAASAQPGAENPSEASGVLPDANTRRLVAALSEVETLSAAYGSCRATLMQEAARSG